jgi:type II secretory pathway pseudopilin PulG
MMLTPRWTQRSPVRTARVAPGSRPIARSRCAQAAASERAESLIELIIAVLILGVALVGVGFCVSLSIKTSGIHRNQAVAGQYLYNYAEQLQSGYHPCSPTPAVTASAYLSDLTVGVPDGFNAPTVSIAFWTDGTRFGPSNPAACPSTDPGLQQLTVTLTSKDLQVSESVVLAVRRATSS